MNLTQEGAPVYWGAALCAAFGRGVIPKSAAQRTHSKTFGFPFGLWEAAKADKRSLRVQL
ncbi:MAG TPA: hypothetical protein VFE51_22925 [Verrucomicrobiae bacterium]|nr:hypothetical protein [Verrucomicrobiae bacterium]